MRGALIAMAAASMAAGCGADLPDGWEDAERVEITQSDCDGNPYQGNQESVTATARAGAIDLLYAKAHFRCEQKVEAFVKASSGKKELLFQPEEMDPSSVADCDCLYNLSASVDAARGAWEVVVWRRWDNLNDGNAPVLVGGQGVTVP